MAAPPAAGARLAAPASASLGSEGEALGARLLGALDEGAHALIAPGGRLIIADFAPHALEFLREAHQHRRLGFSDEEIGRWLTAAGLSPQPPKTLKASTADGLTVKIWTGLREDAAIRLVLSQEGFLSRGAPQ